MLEARDAPGVDDYLTVDKLTNAEISTLIYAWATTEEGLPYTLWAWLGWSKEQLRAWTVDNEIPEQVIRPTAFLIWGVPDGSGG